MPATASHSPYVFDTTDADFEASVIERSLQTPVLLDCWAPWCGPCRSLTPILEKLADDYGGKFVLAKLNSDENPGIAGALRLRSIPAVFLLKGGQVVDQFLGALPEGQVRQFLDKHLGEEVDPIVQLREEAQGQEDAVAVEMLREGLGYAPGHVDLTLDLAERLLNLGQTEDAQQTLDSLPAASRTERHATLLKRIELLKNRPAGDPRQLAARVAANPRDHEARFALAALQVYEGDFKSAFDQLLEVVLRDKGEWREKARLQLIEWFTVCGDPEVVSHGRRYLGMYLN
jgi:putative thioredoxin